MQCETKEGGNGSMFMAKPLVAFSSFFLLLEFLACGAMHWHLKFRRSKSFKIVEYCSLFEAAFRRDLRSINF
jgi:hypothetical protein